MLELKGNISFLKTILSLKFEHSDKALLVKPVAFKHREEDFFFIIWYGHHILDSQ